MTLPPSHPHQSIPNPPTLREGFGSIIIAICVVYALPSWLVSQLDNGSQSLYAILPLLHGVAWLFLLARLQKKSTLQKKTLPLDFFILPLLSMEWKHSTLQWVKASLMTTLGVLFIVAGIQGLSLLAPMIFPPIKTITPFHTNHTTLYTGLLIQASFLSPLLEESLFRGYIITVLNRQWRPWAAIGVSAVLFTALHPLYYTEPTALLQTLLLGLWFGWCRFRFNSIWPAIVAHTVNNAWASYVLFTATVQ